MFGHSETVLFLIGGWGWGWGGWGYLTCLCLSRLSCLTFLLHAVSHEGCRCLPWLPLPCFEPKTEAVVVQWLGRTCSALLGQRGCRANPGLVFLVHGQSEGSRGHRDLDIDIDI